MFVFYHNKNDLLYYEMIFILYSNEIHIKCKNLFQEPMVALICFKYLIYKNLFKLLIKKSRFLYTGFYCSLINITVMYLRDSSFEN